ANKLKQLGTHRYNRRATAPPNRLISPAFCSARELLWERPMIQRGVFVLVLAAAVGCGSDRDPGPPGDPDSGVARDAALDGASDEPGPTASTAEQCFADLAEPSV